jgi:hypothetical protein
VGRPSATVVWGMRLGYGAEAPGKRTADSSPILILRLDSGVGGDEVQEAYAGAP